MSCQEYRKNKCERCIGPDVDDCRGYYQEYKSVCDNIYDIKLSDVKNGDIDGLIELHSNLLKAEKNIDNCISLRDFHTNYCIAKECRDRGHEEFKNVKLKSKSFLEVKRKAISARIESEKQKLREKLASKEEKLSAVKNDIQVLKSDIRALSNL